MQRIFLDWDSPGLPKLVSYFCTNYLHSKILDLSTVSLVLPNQRSGRRLQELLLNFSEEQGIGVIPPNIMTIGALIDKVLKLQPAPGYQVARLQVWYKILASNKSLVQQLFPSEIDFDNYNSLLKLANIIEQVYSDITANLLTAEKIENSLVELGLTPESERWSTLAKLISMFKLELENKFPDHLGQRLERINNHHDFIGDLIVAGCPDLSRLACTLLRHLETHTKIIVFAPESVTDSFDQFGCLINDAWIRPKKFPKTQNIHMVERVIDQCYQVKQILRDQSKNYSTSQIRIASPLEDQWSLLISELTKSIEDQDIQVRSAQGVVFSTRSLGIFLQALTEYISKQSFASFAALCRHPGVLNYLEGILSHQGSSAMLIAVLDTYHKEHLPLTVSVAFSEHDNNGKLLNLALTSLNQLIAGLQASYSLSDFVLKLAELVELIFVNENKLIEQETAEFVKLLSEIGSANDFFELPKLVEAKNKQHNGGNNYLDLLINLLDTVNVPEQYSGTVLELVGWLELQLDDAPLKLVLDFNEGNIPEAYQPNWLLPDNQRKSLGMNYSAGRRARDCYFLTLLSNNTEALHIVSTRQGLNGEVNLPSSLLLDFNSKDFVANLQYYFSNLPKRYNISKKESTDKFTLPLQPIRQSNINHVSITGISSYLNCPYQFYLEHVLKLKDASDSLIELDGQGFGSIAHNILAKFGSSTVAESGSEKQIYEYLNDTLSDYEQSFFNNNTEPAVPVQFEQLRQRLNIFARKQAEHRQQGWRIVATELSWPRESLPIVTSAGTIYLTGRIDRIDLHETELRHAIFDYKLSESAINASKSHTTVDKSTGEIIWTNYQLPAYAYAFFKLSTKLGITGLVSEVEPITPLLGIINICAEYSDIGFDLADWQHEDLSYAWDCMQRTAADILNQKFWPPQGKLRETSPYFCLYGNSFELELELDSQLGAESD